MHGAAAARQFGFALLALAFAAGCGGTSSATVDVGARSHAEVLHQAIAPALEPGNELQQYVQRIGSRLVTAAAALHKEKYGPPSHFEDGGAWTISKDIRFHVVRCPVINVATAGGEHVYVYDALIGRCQSEADLASAMAQAYAHLYARHVPLNLPPLPEGATPNVIALALVDARFTPQQESEADDLALRIYARAGWDPAAFADLLELLGNSPRAAAAQARIDALPPASYAWLKPPVADAQHFEAHRRQVARPGPRPDATAERLLAALPGCLAPGDTPEQLRARRDLQPVIPLPPTESPNPFDKGPRRRPD
jgi:predicted Zn-dependent protease